MAKPLGEERVAELPVKRVPGVNRKDAPCLISLINPLLSSPLTPIY
jgi:hypothetical protein